MTLFSLFRRRSIGAKIFIACAAMCAVTGTLGLYGFYVLSAAGNIAVKTYDGPLMAINFARSASLSFARMDNESLRRAIAPAAERAKIQETITTLADDLSGDLDVVQSRTESDRQLKTIAEIRTLLGEWLRRETAGSRRPDDADFTALSSKIYDQFGVLVELTADYSFVDRRKAVWSVSYFKYTSLGALGLALLLTAAITVILARRIVPPLSQAARIADRIAGGELQTPIPAGGRDETGALLRSMSVMQESIRTMVEREKAERQSAQRRLVDAIEGSREGVVLVDAEGRIVITNSQVAKLCPSVAPELVAGGNFGDAFSQVQSAVVWRADSVDPDNGMALHNPADDAFSVGEYQMTDGRWLRFSRSATQDGGFILFIIDFTEIKEREELFKQAKLDAEVASRAKTNFLANMSHELRTPLNAIIGFSDIIAGQKFGAGNAKYVEYARDILQSGQHLLSIINSVLDLARIEAGKLQIRIETVDFTWIIDQCDKMMRTQCAQAGLRFDVQCPAEPLLVDGEPAKLRQIVLNLLSNAIKFTPSEGSVALQARHNDDGDVEIRITDTGIGMTEDDIALAMTPFSQVDGALARKYEGAGLGLPLTAGFVELHAGRMTIDSAPGSGTRVTVTFPRAAGEPASIASSTAA